MASILNDIKKVLGLAPDYTVFDQDVILHINSVFTTLTQLKVGPPEGFFIENELADWDDFIFPEDNLNAVKSYMFLRVRLLFDPPTTSFHITALENQIKELEWRLNVQVDDEPYSPPAVEPLDV